jgi:NlpC/P60 family
MPFPLIICVLAITTLVGCAKLAQKLNRETVSPSISADRMEPRESPTSPQLSPRSAPGSYPTGLMTSLPSRLAIVESAGRLVGARTLTSQGKRIAYDCAGVTRAIFLEHGIDLYRGAFNDPKGNGVRLIHNHVRHHGTLHQGSNVSPGDLVFFDNTWDFNGDGKLNDPLTHVGVVERLEPDGTVVFISRVANAIERYRMNLDQPHVHKTAQGRVLNDYIRRKYPTDPDNVARLTGELFSGYGNLLSPQKHISSEGTGAQNPNQRRASVSLPSELREQGR